MVALGLLLNRAPARACPPAPARVRVRAPHRAAAMSMFHTHNWAQWVQGERDARLRAKGKMKATKIMGGQEAAEKTQEVLFGNSHERIFPTVPRKPDVPNDAPEKQRYAKDRDELRSTVTSLKAELAAENSVRAKLAAEIEVIREQINSRGLAK